MWSVQHIATAGMVHFWQSISNVDLKLLVVDRDCVGWVHNVAQYWHKQQEDSGCIEEKKEKV